MGRLCARVRQRGRSLQQATDSLGHLFDELVVETFGAGGARDPGHLLGHGADDREVRAHAAAAELGVVDGGFVVRLEHYEGWALAKLSSLGRHQVARARAGFPLTTPRATSSAAAVSVVVRTDRSTRDDSTTPTAAEAMQASASTV